MNIIDRIKIIMEKESIKSDKEFAEIIDIEQKTVWNYLNNRRKPSLEFISRIIAIYPHVNLYWLLTGDGNMDNINTSTEINIDYKEKYYEQLEENKELSKKYYQLLESELESKKTVETGAGGAISAVAKLYLAKL